MPVSGLWSDYVPIKSKLNTDQSPDTMRASDSAPRCIRKHTERFAITPTLNIHIQDNMLLLSSSLDLHAIDLIAS